MPRQTAQALAFTTRETSGRLRVGGELDLAAAPLLDEHLRRLGEHAPPGLVVVDLADVTFIDCSGVRPLLAAQARLGHRLLLTLVPDRVHRFLRLTNLTDVFLIAAHPHDLLDRPRARTLSHKVDPPGTRTPAVRSPGGEVHELDVVRQDLRKARNAVRLLSDTSSQGVREQLFTLGEIPGVLWTPDGAAGARPLILLGHGGGRHKKDPDILVRAHRFVSECGFAAVAIDVPGHGDRPTDDELDRIATENQVRIDAGADLFVLIAQFQALVARRTVSEWRAVLDAVQELEHVGAGPVGYWGVSLGCGLGIPFVAAEPRVRAAVLGLGSASAEAAASVTVPILFLMQWDDERVPREQCLALFDAFGSPEKTLHANPGRHGEVPDFELDSGFHFLTRHL